MKRQHPMYSIWQGIGPTLWHKAAFLAQVVLAAFLFWAFACLMFCL